MKQDDRTIFLINLIYKINIYKRLIEEIVLLSFLLFFRKMIL